MRHTILLLSLAALGFSCSNKPKVSEENVDEYIDSELAIDSTLVKKGVQKNLDYIIENMYSSDDLVKVLSTQPTLYSDLLLIDVKKITEFETSKIKAVNMGIIGADLNYILHFGQTQSSFKYLIGAKQLATQIGVALAFDQKMLDKYQSNFNQKDSLINIVYSAYDNVRKYLRNGEQFQVTTLVIAGSWVENMYLTTEQLPAFQDTEKKAKMYTMILNQQEYLNKIIELQTSLNDENDAFVTNVVAKLQEISNLFTTFKGQKNLSAADVVLLNEKLKNIRTEFVSGK